MLNSLLKAAGFGTSLVKEAPSHQSYVVGLAFSPAADEVILIRKLKPEWQKGLLNGVGGKIEPGEAPIDAMTREFKEETGVDTTLDDWKLFLALRGETSTVYFYRTFMDISKCRTVEKEKVERVRSVPVPFDTVPNLQLVIPMALDNIHPCTLFDEGGLENGVKTNLYTVLEALK